jgi:AraC-like DNA-binding protein
MDALSEALSAVRMTGAIFYNAQYSAPWGVASPRAEELAPHLAPGTERVLIYHLVTHGHALARTAGVPDAILEAGDIVILPHGDAHTISSGSPSTFLDSKTAVLASLNSDDLCQQRFGGGGAATNFVCGFFGCERHAERLFLAGLPPMIKINVRGDAAGAWLENSLRHLVGEAASGRPGRMVLLSKMAEALFIEALRRYMEQLPPEQTGWLAAARDPIVGRALALLHRDPGRAWTANELATQVGASRTVMAERFARFLDVAPLGYLARWRLQLAARLLETTRNTLVQVAGAVGYESEAAFSRAFSREFGMPPARYRRQAREPGSAHRLD